MKNVDKIFSLHLNSNKPNKFEYFAKSFLENMSNPNTLEIIVHIDQDDQLMKAKIEAINNKYIIQRTIFLSKLKQTVLDY